MINRYLFPFIFFLSCNAKRESSEIKNAKWFYYAYAMELNGYAQNGNSVKPLTCDIRLNSVENINPDTTRFYFSLYQKDTLNKCYLKPLSLSGITAVKNNLYIPIYNYIFFYNETDSLLLAKMNKQNILLLEVSLRKNSEVNNCLHAEAERRKSN